MLKVLLGTDWVANRDAILNQIAEDTRKSLPNRILIVPELISHDMERRLCETAGDAASRFAEVLSFSRLADRVTTQLGLADTDCLDNGGRIVAMAAAVRLLHSKLKAYASIESRPEFLSDLVDAIDEFKCCMITPDQIRDASAAFDGVFAQKLEEISLIYDAYESICKQGKRDPRDRMTLLLEQLEDGDYVQEHVFYIDGFPDFTRQHMAILEHLIRYSPNVVISLNCDRADSDAIAFEKAGQTASELIRCAGQLGVEVRVETVEARSNGLEEVRARLFENKTEFLDLGSRLLTIRTDSIRQECAAVVQKISSLVQAGCRYRDIGVVCADMGAYKNTISMICHRSGIPIYLAGSEELLEKNAITAVFSVMEAALCGFERNDVMRYLKSMLSPIPVEVCDLIDRYAYIWSVSGSGWLKEWNNHPRGPAEHWQQQDYDDLARINQARSAALVPLERFRDAFSAAQNMAQQTQALYTLFEQIHLEQTFCRLADEFDAKGENRNAQIFSQLWEILISALEQLHDILGQTVWDNETFTQLFKLLLSQYDVGTIPTVLDSVMIGPVSAMRCQQLKHLFVIGVTEGTLPGYGSATGVLSDTERLQLRKLGVPVNDGSIVGLQAEFAEIYGVFCGAEESIQVYCPSGQPSFVFQRLSAMAGGESKYTDILGSAMTNATEAAALLSRHGAQTYAEELSIADEYEHLIRQKYYTPGDVGTDTVSSLYGKSLNLSASQIDKLAECRMAHFLRYGLRAKEWEIAQINPAEFGLFVHSVLEDTVRKIKELGGFENVELDQATEIASEYAKVYADEHFAQFDSDRLAYLNNRNLFELDLIVRELWHEMRNSAFEPYEFELAFGDGEKMPAIQIPNDHFAAKLRGYVDRVDVWNDEYGCYVRVVDYKTGKKDFDYCDIINGHGLQMLLYLFALEQEGSNLLHKQPLPAGVLYFPARAPYESTDSKLSDEEADRLRAKVWKRKGLILSSDHVIDAMEQGGEYRRLPISKKKDGTINGDLATPTQFAQLSKYVFSLLNKMVDDVASGNIEPNPYTRGTNFNACKYCPFGSVCRPETVCGRRDYKAIKQDEFWNDIEKEVSSHG